MTPPLPISLQRLIDNYQDWVSRYLRGSPGNHGRPLYHYTPLDSGDAILADRSQRYRYWRDLDDTWEIKFGRETGRSILQERLKSADRVSSHFLSEFLNHIDLAVDKFGYYVASFSFAENESHLWKEYADNGNGVRLCFPPVAFKPTATPALQLPLQDRAILSKVFYGKDHCEKLHLQPIEKALRCLETAKAKLGAAPPTAFLERLAVEMAIPFLFNCLRAKRGTYRVEQEARLVIVGEHSALQAIEETGTDRKGNTVRFITRKLDVLPSKQTGRPLI